MKQIVKKMKREVITYDFGDGFFVDVEEDFSNNDIIEIYLYNINYGIKMHMFGIGKCVEDIEFIISVDVEEYIEDYRREYMNN